MAEPPAVGGQGLFCDQRCDCGRRSWGQEGVFGYQWGQEGPLGNKKGGVEGMPMGAGGEPVGDAGVYWVTTCGPEELVGFHPTTP